MDGNQETIENGKKSSPFSPQVSGDELPAVIASYIDHTLLSPGVTEEDALRLCTEAKEYGFYGVCIPPAYVPTVVKELSGHTISVVTVVSFPFGEDTTKVKVYSASDAVVNGARELDVVVDLGRLLSADYAFIAEELKEIVSEVTPIPIKAIIETPLLYEQQIISAVQVVMDNGCAMVKTSTGFSTTPTKIQDVELINRTVKGKIGIKAAGGIRSYESAKAMLSAGATRLGTSYGLVIVNEAGYSPGSST